MKCGTSLNKRLQTLYQKCSRAAPAAPDPRSPLLLSLRLGEGLTPLKTLQKGTRAALLSGGAGDRGLASGRVLPGLPAGPGPTGLTTGLADPQKGLGQIRGFAEPCRFLVSGPVEAVQFISDGEAVGLQLPSLQPEMDLPPAVTISTASKAQLGKSLLESQPLIRASGRGDCLAGVLPPSDPRQGQPGTAEALAPLSSCASEMQHKWPHAPVECTELDLQKFSTQAEFVGGERPEEAASRAAQRIPAESGGVGREGARRPPSAFPNPTAESGEQPVSSSGLVAPPNRRRTPGARAQGAGLAGGLGM